MKKILIVEDDSDLAQGIKMALRRDGLDFYIANSFKKAEKMQKEEVFSLILLDINLPDGNGITLCERIREHSLVPVIFLTANDMEYDEVAGLEAGGDDYIKKPFSLAVLRARVDAVLRRKTEESREPNVYRYKTFHFVFDDMQFFKEEQEVILSKTEQKVLRILTANAGNIVSRSLLLDKVWSGSGEFVDENALSVVISRLRSKLEENPQKPKYIKTEYGIGYRWEEETG